MKVSVIVAVYNAEKYLRQCMDAIVGQSLRDIEIICVNDGSTDSSLEILEGYAASDTRIKIYTKENEGLGGASARNLGLEKASGEYISILDSDDYFDTRMLEHAVNRADETNADIVVFGGYEYDERNGNTYKVDSILNYNKIPQKDVFSYKDCAGDIYQLSQGMAWNKLYRKSFLDKHGLRFQKIKYTDDAYFTFAHMVLADRIAVLKENLIYYRVNSGVSQTDGLANYPDSSWEPYKKLKDSLEEWGIYETVKQSFVNCAACFMRYFYDKINKYEAFSYLHAKYRNEVFNWLNIDMAPKEYFYDERVWMWKEHVRKYTDSEMLFEIARSYGSGNTSGIMRFQFPYEKLPRESKIALFGAGIMGRHYYSQIMLNGYCDVVVWADRINPCNLSYISSFDEVKSKDFDYAVVAYVQPELCNVALQILNEMNFDKKNIIFGGVEA